MKKQHTESKRISVRIRRDVYEAISDIAQREQRLVSVVLEQLIRDGQLHREGKKGGKA